MKRVPEKTKKRVPNRDEQLKQLLRRLAGHEAFGRLRGTFDRNTDQMEHLARLISKTKSPTAFCAAWDQYSADVRVIGNILAQLRREGWGFAADELESALKLSGYMLPGETLLLDQTTPLTVLIIDFPKTHAMITWIRAGHWMNLNDFLNGEKVGPLTERLFNQFPSLQTHTRIRQRRGDYEGWDLLAAHHDDVISPFLHDVLSVNDNESWLNEARPMKIGWDTFNDHLEISEGKFGYIFLGDQASVLSHIPREHQHRVTTFGFYAPKIITDLLQKNQQGPSEQSLTWKSTFSVGFHPEVRHGEWMRVGGAYPSLGCAQDYGAVLLDRRRHGYGDYLRWYNGMYGCGGAILRENNEEVAFILQPE